MMTDKARIAAWKRILLEFDMKNICVETVFVISQDHFLVLLYL